MTAARAGAWAMLAVLATGAHGLAQSPDELRIERAGRGEPALDRALERILRSGNYLLIARDTVLARGDTVPRSVLVLGATVAVEGSIIGDLVAVASSVYLRPSAYVAGDVVSSGGGLYRSELALIGGARVEAPDADYRVVREPGTIRIVAVPPGGDGLVLDGVGGFHAPTYDRVDGASIQWGATYHLPLWRGWVEPRVHGLVGYRSERGALTGGLELTLERGPNTLALGAEETTVTNEEWIRDDLDNSLAFFFRGKDYRNYYEATRWYVELGRRWPPKPRASGDTRGRWRWRTAARAQLEDARSLARGHPWTLFGPDSGQFRLNPPIDDGRIASLVLDGRGEWRGSSSVFEGGAEVELAGAVAGGDFTFGRYLLWGEWAMQALADHTLEVEWRFMGPLPGTGSLPRQRWSFVGGSGTLYTFDIGQFLGDRLVFAKSEYTIPLGSRFRLPIVGPPDLKLMHVVGMAWSRDTERSLEQNVAVRLQYFGPYARVATNPVRPLDDVELSVGISLPGRPYPWEARVPR
jgi:hypothetical protein